MLLSEGKNPWYYAVEAGDGWEVFQSSPEWSQFSDEQLVRACTSAELAHLYRTDIFAYVF